MVTDPLLDAHRKNDLHYVISGPQPISVRDQMLRGAAIAERLVAAGEIGPNRPLVVSGAGAGGATAAMVASERGVETTLIERSEKPFLTQHLAASRWIDPTQYDWPLDHYNAGTLPWDTTFHRDLPLTFRAAPANHLAAMWRTELDMPPPLLRVLTDNIITKVLPFGVSGPTEMLEIVLHDGPPIRAGAIIDAHGFGREKCAFYASPSADPVVPQPPDYEGVPFWSNDSLQHLTHDRHRVLISGSGDGALQDYLRIITHRPSAGDIVARCDVPPATLRTIQSAEDRAARGRSWASDEPRGCRVEQEGPYLIELDYIHRIETAKILARRGIETVLNRVVPAQVVPVHLVYRDAYMSAYYGLNRFLVRLLSEFIKLHRGGKATVFPEVEIASIGRSSPDHECIDSVECRAKGTYDPISGLLTSHDCFERDHAVSLKSTVAGTLMPPTVPSYNVVIIRHGVLPTPGLNLKRTRHLLPYHLAGR